MIYSRKHSSNYHIGLVWSTFGWSNSLKIQRNSTENKTTIHFGSETPSKRSETRKGEFVSLMCRNRSSLENKMSRKRGQLGLRRECTFKSPSKPSLSPLKLVGDRVRDTSIFTTYYNSLHSSSN